MSKLLGTEVEKGIVAKPDTMIYKVYTDTMEYVAEIAAQKSNSSPEWFLGKWKFHTDPRVRGETILRDAGMEEEPTWRNIITDAKEKLPEMRQERQARRAERAFKGAVRKVLDGLWNVLGFTFKGDVWPPIGDPEGHGGGASPGAAASSLPAPNVDVRYTGSPPRGVRWQKLPRQGGGAPGGAGAGAVEAAVEEPCEECYN